MQVAVLPAEFLARPIAHRALHGLQDRCPENSRAAIRAAIEADYGVEIDLQLSADGQAMVFHDDLLDRLTAESGPVKARTAADLCQISLNNSADEGIPTFSEVLEIVAGQVPLLVEIKDQDGALGGNVGPLEAAAVAALVGYSGPVALMAFNPNSIAELARLAPQIPRGLTTSAYDPEEWAPLPAARCDSLREIPDFERVGASFISHEACDVARPRVQALRAAGVPILSWTLKSAAEEEQVRQYVDNVTFEGYLSQQPA